MKEYTILIDKCEICRIWTAEIEDNEECIGYGSTEEEAVDNVKFEHQDYLLLNGEDEDLIRRCNETYNEYMKKNR